MKPKQTVPHSGFRCLQMHRKNKDKVKAKKLRKAVKQLASWTVTPVETTTVRPAGGTDRHCKASKSHSSPMTGCESRERQVVERRNHCGLEKAGLCRPPSIAGKTRASHSYMSEPSSADKSVAGICFKDEFAFVHENNKHEDCDTQQTMGPLSLAALKKQGKLRRKHTSTTHAVPKIHRGSPEDLQGSSSSSEETDSEPDTEDEADGTVQCQSDFGHDLAEHSSDESSSSSCEEERLPVDCSERMESYLWHHTSANSSAYCADNESGGDYYSERGSHPDTFKGGFRVFSLQNRLQVALARPPTVFQLRGRAILRVLHGAVDIAGYILTPGNILNREGLVVQGGLLSSAVKISLLPAQSDSSLSKLVQGLQHLDPSSWEAVSPHFDMNTTVVLLKKAEGRWPAIELVVEGLTELPELKGSYAGLGFYMCPAKDSDKYLWGKLFPGLATRLVKAATSPEQETPRVLICGPRNSGKSTLLRMLVNCLLNVCPEVIYLDCDPGQTEFSPPGTVSLSKVTLPLLGPPFTHVQAPEKTYFLGDVTPAAYPDSYSKAILSLVEFKDQHYANIPLVVNTMGWVSGIGLSLLVDVIRWVVPTDLVQLVAEPSCLAPFGTSDMPLMYASTVQLACGWLSSRKGSAAESREPALDGSYSFHQFKAVSRKTSSHASLTRQAKLLSYLSQGHHLSAFCLWSLTPYRLPWSSVAIHECSGAVQKQDLLFVLNASLVALCTVPKEQLLETEVTGYPMFLKENPPYECIGYGIVRAVDPEEKVFYILTPEPRHRLSKVNALIKGNVNIPEVLLKKPVRSLKKGQCFPYIAKRVSKLSDTDNHAGKSDSESSCHSDQGS